MNMVYIGANLLNLLPLFNKTYTYTLTTQKYISEKHELLLLLLLKETHTAKAVLEPTLPPKWWDYRYVLPLCLALSSFRTR